MISIEEGDDDCLQADLSKKETIRLTKNGRDGQLQHGLPDWLYEGDPDDYDRDEHLSATHPFSTSFSQTMIRHPIPQHILDLIQLQNRQKIQDPIQQQTI